MSTNSHDWSLLLALPDDLFAIITRSLSPKDICNLMLCCRSLNTRAASDMVWLTQCEMVDIVSYRELVEWHKVVSSYKLLCKFLVGVKPLMGIWVHQNPELGNVVYVMPGFVSVIGCRVIPQELGPLGIEDGSLLWTPVFEIVADDDGSAVFFLHGREKDCDYIYPGSVKSVEKTCNVLLLEVEPRKLMKNGEDVAQSISFRYAEDDLKDLVPERSISQYFDDEQGRKVTRSEKRISKSQRLPEQNLLTVPFSKLSFGDKKKLLEMVTCQVRLEVPNSADSPLFLCLREDEVIFKREIMHLSKRRALLIKMHKFERERRNRTDIHETSSLDFSSGFQNSLCDDESDGSSSTESKHAQLHDFRHSGDQVGLTLHASTMELSYYRDWPVMHDSQFALYKLLIKDPTPGRIPDHSSGFRNSLSGDDTRSQFPRRRSLSEYRRNSIKQMMGRSKLVNRVRGLASHVHHKLKVIYNTNRKAPTPDQKYAGLWGGTFGWPPGKPGEALFFLVLSYQYHDELPGKRLLIATKILEGASYALYPNGSDMFAVNFDEQSLDPFPWTTDADALPVLVKSAFTGEGIADGYGFRYPGSKPGSLFELQDGMLAFLWKESGDILTLRRLDLQKLLKKGEQVAALPPISNFSYLDGPTGMCLQGECRRKKLEFVCTEFGV